MRKDNYKYGATLEYEVASKLRTKGYLVIRSAGSHTPIDLIAIPVRRRKKKILLIQCKKSSNNLKIESVLEGIDVLALVNLSLDNSLRRMLEYVVVIKRNKRHSILQFVYRKGEWQSVQII